VVDMSGFQLSVVNANDGLERCISEMTFCLSRGKLIKVHHSLQLLFLLLVLIF